MDETPIKAGRAEAGKMKQSWFWPIYGQDEEVCFIHAASRGSDVVSDILGDRFVGVLLTDGHAAYAHYSKDREQVIEANCWAHVRYKFEAALSADPQAANPSLTTAPSFSPLSAPVRPTNLRGY